MARPGHDGIVLLPDGRVLEYWDGGDSTGRAMLVHTPEPRRPGSWDEYAVFGLSGGGPFAVATAVADPIHVRALGIVGGIGPWRILEDASRDPEGSRCLDLLDAGDVAGAWDCMRRDVDRAYVGFGELDDEARVDALLARIDAESDQSS